MTRPRRLSGVKPEPEVTPSVVGVVVFGALCELDDDDIYMPEFVYDCPALRHRVATLPAPANTETPDPDTPDPDIELPPLRRWFERESERRPRRWFRRRFEDVTLVHMPLDHRHRSMTSRERRSEIGSLSVTEFADLSDGQRVVLRNDRGYGSIWGDSPGPLPGVTRQSLAEDIRYYLVQLEEDRPTSPEWAVELVARLYDIEIDLASVQAALRAPYHVEFGPHLSQQLQH